MGRVFGYVRPVSDVDPVLQEAIRYARTPIERSFGGVGCSPQRRAVRTITHRLAHLIVRAERDRQYWTMVAAKYFLDHLDKAIGSSPCADTTLESFRIRLREVVSGQEARNGDLDISEVDRLVVMSGNTSDRILTGPTFENSMRVFASLPRIERKLSSFVSTYIWDQTS